MVTCFECGDELLGPVFSSLQTVQEKHHAVIVPVSLSFCLDVLLKFDFILRAEEGKHAC